MATDFTTAIGALSSNSRTTIIDGSAVLAGKSAAFAHVHLYNTHSSAIEVTIELSDDNGSSWKVFDTIDLASEERQITDIPFPMDASSDLALTSDNASGLVNWAYDTYAIKTGFIKVYTRQQFENRSATAISTDSTARRSGSRTAATTARRSATCS